MKITQVELKKAEIKSLVSMDKSLRLTFDVNLNEDNDVDINGIRHLMYKGLTLEIKVDG